MNVAQLIAELSALPGAAEVFIDMTQAENVRDRITQGDFFEPIRIEQIKDEAEAETPLVIIHAA